MRLGKSYNLGKKLIEYGLKNFIVNHSNIHKRANLQCFLVAISTILWIACNI